MKSASLLLPNEIFRRKFDVPKNGSEQARTEDLAGVDWDSCDSAIWMAKEEVAATTTDNFKAEPFEESNEFLALEARKASHSEIC